MDRGTLIGGHYRIERTLGSGGFADVYLARDVESGRKIAIKILKSSMNDPSQRARFRREMKALADLRSAHTVTLFDHGTTESGDPYLVMELVEGEDLAAALRRLGRLEGPVIGHILDQVLDSLAEAHAAGLLHRDLKPENIRISAYDGDPWFVKVLDFGLAKSMTGAAQNVTEKGELVGTPRYMSPEQLTEQELTPASDIYSLGLVAYEMLLGRDALHGGKWSDQLDRLRTGAALSIPEIERIGPRLPQVIGKMTARDPRDRYASARAVQSALGGVERRPETSDRPGRVPWWALALAAVAFVLVGVMLAHVLPDKPSPDRVVSRRDVPGIVVQPNTEPPSEPLRPQAVVDAAVADVRADLADAGVSHGAECAKVEGFIRMGDAVAYVPPGFDAGAKRPVMLVLHNDFQNPKRAIERNHLSSLADKERIVLVAPESADELSMIPGVSFTWKDPAKSEAVIRRALGDADDRLCLGDTGVVALGIGAGADVAMSLPCWEDFPLAAIATTAFRFRDEAELCSGYRPVPLIHFNQSKDGNYPREGGKGCGFFVKSSLERHLTMISDAHECEGPKGKSVRRKDGVCRRWRCETAFVSCEIEGGRGWPGEEVGAMECHGPPSEFPYLETIRSFIRREVHADD